MRSTLQEIKDRVSIVDIVSTYIKVDNFGKQYKARCPFHQEKTPSFYLSPDRNTYHCFGCGKGGDVISFVQEIEGIEFRDALKLIAERYGIPFVIGNEFSEKKDKTIFDVLSSAKDFFVEQRKKHSFVETYLNERGLNSKTIDDFMIGYAVDEWRSLYEHLRKHGFTDSAIVESGLIVKTEKGFYDRFRARIMFPITDTQGRIIAFTGRIVPHQKVKTLGEEPAKYVNSPETKTFKKSSVLFGYSFAKQSMRTKDRVIIVEGQMDAIMAHQFGFNETVAVSGTAFTEEQIDLIARFTKKMYFALDNDNAGVKALMRSIPMALEKGMELYVLPLKGGKDPADILLEHPDTFKQAVLGPVTFIEFLLDFYKHEYKDLRLFRNKVESDLLKLLALIKKPIEKAHYVNIVARSIDVDDKIVFDSLNLLSGTHKNYFDHKHEIKNPEIKKDQKNTRDLLRGLVLLNQTLKENRINESVIEKVISEHVGDVAILLDVPEKEVLISEAEFLFGTDNLLSHIKELAVQVEKEDLVSKLYAMKKNLHTDESLSEYQRLRARLDTIKNIHSDI